MSSAFRTMDSSICQSSHLPVTHFILALCQPMQMKLAIWHCNFADISSVTLCVRACECACVRVFMWPHNEQGANSNIILIFYFLPAPKLGDFRDTLRNLGITLATFCPSFGYIKHYCLLWMEVVFAWNTLCSCVHVILAEYLFAVCSLGMRCKLPMI